MQLSVVGGGIRHSGKISGKIRGDRHGGKRDGVQVWC